MGQYLVRRLLQAIPLLILISVLMFILLHLLPGGPEAVLDNPQLDEAGRAALRASYGLNDPLPVQYFKWIGNALRGNFGFSFSTGQSVTDILAQRLPATLELFISAFVLALLLTLVLGIYSAVRQGQLTDYTITTLAYFGISMPIFLLGLFFQDIFGVALGWLPTSGTATLGYTFSPLNTFLDHLLHLIMPMLVLAISFTARWSRYLRASMIDVIKQDYIRTARAKGVSSARLFTKHALRNAIIPLITIVAIDFGAVAGGATITEGIFAWPGMGLLFINSLEKRDFPVLLAMLMLSGILVILFNLIADILYGVMDPRIRYS
ncbi:oligopeptide transport system permease protein AppB [Reticulibacter mediterranei]|uniref:Oligopeptide transport system permease protein AppB n=1 Tax=Reticulibacter mediterranei TaxID=2778369 RepID=A0A8J3INJ9_9CHLR|nr:ABC transporter permease [Reticulibacter mediterranei]GHO93616.1 oligopeptide transport system permease protein AppB [Reticulibacter mediterranei]